MKKLIFSSLIISALAGLITGCVPSKPGQDIEILPSERLINKLEVNRRRISNFEGSGVIHVQSKNLNSSATFRVVLQKPDSIYLTVFGPFGIQLAQSLVTSSDFVFYDVLQNTAYTGKLDDTVLQEIFKINLSFNDLMDAFIGAVNLTSKLYQPPDKYEVVYDQYILTYIDSVNQNVTRYVVDVRQLGIKEFQLTDSNGTDLIHGTYSDFELLENVAVPNKITVTNNFQNQQFSIEYRQMKANQKNIFIDFKLPDDALVIKW